MVNEEEKKVAAKSEIIVVQTAVIVQWSEKVPPLFRRWYNNEVLTKDERGQLFLNDHSYGYQTATAYVKYISSEAAIDARQVKELLVSSERAAGYQLDSVYSVVDISRDELALIASLPTVESILNVARTG